MLNRWLPSRRRKRLRLESVREDGLDALIVGSVQREGAGAGRLQSGRGMLCAQSQHSQRSPVALHGVGAGGEERFTLRLLRA